MVGGFLLTACALPHGTYLRNFVHDDSENPVLLVIVIGKEKESLCVCLRVHFDVHGAPKVKKSGQAVSSGANGNTRKECVNWEWIHSALGIWLDWEAWPPVPHLYCTQVRALKMQSILWALLDWKQHVPMEYQLECVSFARQDIWCTLKGRNSCLSSWASWKIKKT